jgi:hypothetical protein
MTVSGQFNIENTGGPFTCTGSLTFTVTAAGKIEPAGECTFTATGSNQPVIISVSGAPFDYAADSTFDGSIDVGVQVPNLSKGTTKSAKMKGQFKSKTALEATLSTPFGDTFNLGSNPTTTAKLQGGTFTGSK